MEIADGDRSLLRVGGVDGETDPRSERVAEAGVDVEVSDWSSLRILYHLRYGDEVATLLRGFGGDARRTFAWDVRFNRMTFGPYRPAQVSRRPAWAVRNVRLDPPDAPAGTPATVAVVVANEGDAPAPAARISIRPAAAAGESAPAVEGAVPRLSPAATAEVRLSLPAPGRDEAVEITTPSGSLRWSRPRRARPRIVAVAPARAVRTGETLPLEILVVEEEGVDAADLRLVLRSPPHRIEAAFGARAGETAVVRLDLPPHPAGRHGLDVRVVRDRIVLDAGRFDVEVLPPPRPRSRVGIHAVRSNGGVRLDGFVENGGDGDGAFAAFGHAAGETFSLGVFRLSPGESVPVSFTVPAFPGGWDVGLIARTAGGAADGAARTVYVPHPPRILADEGETILTPTTVEGRITRGVAWRADGETEPLRLTYDLGWIPPREVEERIEWSGRVIVAGGPAVLDARSGAFRRRLHDPSDAAETLVRVSMPFAPQAEVSLHAPAGGARSIDANPLLRLRLRRGDVAELADVRWETGVGRLAVSFRLVGRSVLRPRSPVTVRLTADGRTAAETLAPPGARARLEAALPPGIRTVRLALTRPPAVGDSDLRVEAAARLFVPGPGRPRLSFARPPVLLNGRGARSAALVAVDDSPVFAGQVSVDSRVLRFDAAAGETLLVVAHSRHPWRLLHPAGARIAGPVRPVAEDSTWRVVAVEADPPRVRWALENLGPPRPPPAAVAAVRGRTAGRRHFDVARVVDDGGRAATRPFLVPTGGVVWMARVAPGPADVLLWIAGGALLRIEMPLGDGPTFAAPVLARPEGASSAPPSGWDEVARAVAAAAAVAPGLETATAAAAALARTADELTPEGRLAARAAADRLGAEADRLAREAERLPWPASASTEDVRALAAASDALASAAAPPVLDRPTLLAFAERFAAALIPLAEAPPPSTRPGRDATVRAVE